MALFGLFGKRDEGSALRKLAARAANKRGQAPDRWEAIEMLCSMRDRDGVEALIPRFGFYVDPSITDQEEKDLAFRGIVDAGEVALEPLADFLRSAPSISWPLKMLDRLLQPEQVVTQLIELLAGMDTEYERDPEKKVQTLTTLEERSDSRIVEAATRFLQDTNETVRFNATGAILSQQDASAAREAFIDCLCLEESLRIKNRILDGFIAREWGFDDRQDEARAKLPPEFFLDKKGALRKKA